MNVLSLFDGMSCGRLALDKAKIKYNTYYAAEVDKYAIKVSQANYPDTVQLGDVTQWREWDVDWSSIGLLLGGSPCQGFSFAGKQLAFDDPRSALFFVYVDILNHIKRINPDVKFLLENVRMKKEYLDVIGEQLGVEPVMINSALLSAQNRVRFYWCNWQVNQPDDKGILLKDIIESNPDAKYDLSQKLIDGFENSKSVFKDRFKPHNVQTDKSYCLTARYYKMGKTDPYIDKKSLCNQVGIASDIRGNESIKRIYGTDGKCPTLTTMGGGHREPKIALDKTQYRKLTPLECERLQTVPDNYTNHVSNTQRYKMLGNGWTVDVIAHIFKEYFSA